VSFVFFFGTFFFLKVQNLIKKTLNSEIQFLKELELYKTHYLKQCKFHENDKEEIIKTLQKPFSEDEVGN
jgi:hypothetical protein